MRVSVRVCVRACVRTDPSLEGHPDLGLVGDEPDGRAQHLVLGALDGVRLDADHLPADLLEGQDLGDRRSLGPAGYTLLFSWTEDLYHGGSL